MRYAQPAPSIPASVFEGSLLNALHATRCALARLVGSAVLRIGKMLRLKQGIVSRHVNRELLELSALPKQSFAQLTFSTNSLQSRF